MKKIIISIGVIIILAGVYIFIKDQQIKKELSTVGESQFVENNDAESEEVKSDSKITVIKKDGVWTSNTTGMYSLDTSFLKFKFTGYKPGGQHVGTFNTVNGEIALDADGSPVQMNLVLDPKSIKTDASALDTHLQAAEFFDSATYPEVVVMVKEFKKEGDTVNAITDLTIKGVTKTLSIPVKVVNADDGMVFSIDTRIKISDYAIAYGPVLDEVRLTLSGVLHKTNTTNTQ